MDRLPQELISAILSNIDKREGRYQKARLATISRQWQYAVERINLHSFILKDADLELFASLLSQRHRHALVKSVTFYVVLPGYSDNACRAGEAEAAREATSRVFSEAVHALFGVLEGVENEEGIYLCVGSYSQKVPYRPEHFKTQITDPEEPKDLWERRYRASFLHLGDPGKLPVLTSVGEFYYCMNTHERRNDEPASVLAMVAKMKGLRKTTLNLCDRGSHPLEVRQMSRYSMSSHPIRCIAQLIKPPHV